MERRCVWQHLDCATARDCVTAPVTEPHHLDAYWPANPRSAWRATPAANPLISRPTHSSMTRPVPGISGSNVAVQVTSVPSPSEAQVTSAR